MIFIVYCIPNICCQCRNAYRILWFIEDIHVCWWLDLRKHALHKLPITSINRLLIFIWRDLRQVHVLAIDISSKYKIHNFLISFYSFLIIVHGKYVLCVFFPCPFDLFWHYLLLAYNWGNLAAFRYFLGEFRYLLTLDLSYWICPHDS